MDIQNKSVLIENIRQTIKRMKRDGTTGCSIENLKQCTPTNGLSCSVSMYHLEFPKIALEIAKKYHFGIL
jgi:hypothetical protein